MNLVIKISWDDVLGVCFPPSYSNNTVWPLKNAVGFTINLQTFYFFLAFFLSFCV